jgi:hypothetical protein
MDRIEIKMKLKKICIYCKKDIKIDEVILAIPKNGIVIHKTCFEKMKKEVKPYVEDIQNK